MNYMCTSLHFDPPLIKSSAIFFLFMDIHQNRETLTSKSGEFWFAVNVFILHQLERGVLCVMV